MRSHEPPRRPARRIAIHGLQEKDAPGGSAKGAHVPVTSADVFMGCVGTAPTKTQDLHVFVPDCTVLDTAHCASGTTLSVTGIADVNYTPVDSIFFWAQTVKVRVTGLAIVPAGGVLVDDGSTFTLRKPNPAVTVP
jgi:hypothetical protein